MHELPHGSQHHSALRWETLAGWLAAVLFSATCGPVKPPTPQPPTFRTVAVVDAGGQAVGQVYVDDTGGGHLCTLADGYCEVQAHDAPVLVDTYVTVQAEGFEPYRADAVRLPAGNVQVWLGPGCGMPSAAQCVNLPPLAPSFRPLPRVVTADWYFRLETGEAWTWIGASDFDLYRQYLEAERGGAGRGRAAIAAVLRQRGAIGFNVLRVFGSFNGSLGRFVPTDYGELWYTALPGFADAVAGADCRCYLELTVFADATQWIPSAQEQIRHWNLAVAALADRTNVFLEVVNEADQPINRLDALPSVGMPATLNSSHGSNGAGAGGHGAWGPTPFWHFTALHSNLDPEWQRAVGHNCYEIGWLISAPNGWRGPCVGDENKRPDQDGTLTRFYDAAAGAALLAAGSTYHSNQGKASQVFTGLELEAAQQWVAGARSVPLSCQPGAYSHREDLEGSTYLRVYQRGSSEACIVRIRP